MKSITLLSPAKVNLTLKVQGKRTDGYHEIESIMQPVDLFDIVKIEVENGDEILLNLRGIKIPREKDNLAYKAAQLYLKRSGTRKKIIISIDKVIPIGAGLGGGSSNAAAVLVGLNRLLNILNENELMEISLELGADVVFFIRCRSAFVKGIGEKVTTLKNFPVFHYVVIYPRFAISTWEVYKKWDNLNSKYSDEKSEFEELIRNFSNTISELFVFNDLERPAFSICPSLEKYKKLMQSLDSKSVIMSGSGSCIFAVFRKDRPAKELYNYLSSNNDIDIFLLKGISGWHRLAD